MYQNLDEGSIKRVSMKKMISKVIFLTVGVAVAAAVCLVAASMFGEQNTVAAGVRARSGCRNVQTHAMGGRRAALSGMFSAAALAAAGRSRAETAGVAPPEFIDDRKAVKTGFNIIYEARDLSLDQDTRDGMTQARTGVSETKARIADASKKLEEAGKFIDKKYWTEGRNILRRLVGTLRFDLAVIADSKSGQAKKDAIKNNKDFFAALEKVDLAMKKKDQDAAQKAFPKAVAAYKLAAGF